MLETVIAFPSREAFYQGMSLSFYNEFEEFRKMYSEASEITGHDLYEISYCNNRLFPELHTVCLITHCLGIYHIVREYIPVPTASIGLSHGEFTAIVAAGVLTLENILNLVISLEKLILENQNVLTGTMVRMFGIDIEELEKCISKVDPKRETSSVAIYLSKDQNIISGDKNSIKSICHEAKKNGLRWAIPLRNPGAFHNPLCLEIIDEAKPVFECYNFKDSHFDVYNCSSGKCTKKGGEIKKNLSVQIANSVLWNFIIQDIENRGVQQVLELGPGCTVSGNSRIISSKLQYQWINDVASFETAMNSM